MNFSAILPVSVRDRSKPFIKHEWRCGGFARKSRSRRITTTLDVRRDQSLIVSGLFAGEEERVKTGLPLLKDIPILGVLFSSTRFQRNESELIVIVTPTILDPMNPRPRDVLTFPADTTRPATDALKTRKKP